MNKTNNHKLTGNAKVLRKNTTKEERHLWYDFLKNLPITINRQKVINNYILDFYCAKEKIAIELDGSQHYDDEASRRDAERDTFLSEIGIEVLRYSNLDINRNFEGVCTDILEHLKLSLLSTPD